MFQDVSAVRYPSNVAADLVNARVNPDGTVSRRNGTKRTHPTSLGAATGYGAVEFTRADGVVQILAFVGATIKMSSDQAATWTDVTPVTPRADYYSFATMRVGATMWLFAANGDAEVWRWDGTTFTALPNAPTGVKYLAVFNGRLWFAGHSGVIVQATKIGDPTVTATPDGLLVQILTHDGDVPTGMYQLGAHLLVFDSQSTSYIDGFGEQTIIVAAGATGFSRSVGCIAFRTIVGVGEDAVCWLSHRGVEYYSPNSGIQLLTRGVQTFLQTIDRIEIASIPGLPTATYDEITQEYHLALSTTGVRNNRALVINLLQRGTGWLGAPSVDQQRGATNPGAALKFLGDVDGYLDDDAAGVALTDDADGYGALSVPGDGILPTIPDANGYLTTDVTDAMASSLFVAAGPDQARQVYSLGYDGFVRRHGTGEKDDVASDGTGGIDVELSMVSRPFLLKRPRQQKWVRAVHVASINDADATLTVGVRSSGVVLRERDVVIPGTQFNQPKRKRLLVSAVGDAPQVQVRSIDPVRLALVGVSVDLQREPL